MKSKIKLLLLSCMLCATIYKAQAQVEAPQSVTNQKQRIKVVLENPEFPGGEKELFKFLSKQMKYPPKALAAKKEGKAVFKFIVNEDGSLSNITPQTKDQYGFAQEGLRIIKRMPKWKPAKQDGAPIKMYYSLPINFKIKK